MKQTGWCLNLGEEADVVYFVTSRSVLPFYVRLHISLILKTALYHWIILFPSRVMFHCERHITARVLADGLHW